MADKCTWCAKTRNLTVAEITPKKGSSEEVFVCSSDCENRFRQFVEYAESHVPHFLVGLFLPLLGVIGIYLDYETAGLLFICVSFGLVLIVYPFATPQTIAWLGAKRSITLVRATGFLSILAGVVIAAGLSM